MSRVVVLGGLAASCNTAAVRYDDPRAHAPGALGGWNGPSHKACEQDRYMDPRIEIDGFYFCAEENARKSIVPVDEPVHVACGASVLSPDTEMLTAFDGVRARAWPVAALIGRELVHEQWGDEPLLVDY